MSFLFDIVGNAYAQTTSTTITRLSDFTALVIKLINWGIGFFWVCTVGFMMWSAYLFLFAGEDKKKVDQGKAVLKYTVIAATVALFSTAVKPILENILQSGGPQ